MKLKVAALTLLPLMVSSYASASVELQIPKQVDVLLVNGEKPDLSDGFFHLKKALHFLMVKTRFYLHISHTLIKEKIVLF